MIKKAVVVGGSGFIGSHVADYLNKAGYQVTIYDKIDSKWKQAGQDMIVGNVLDSDKLNQAITGAHVVYNFAALADLDQAIKQPIKTVNINILGNLNVMEACRLHGVKRFIYASTVYVHSREGGFYRCSKQAAEAYVEEYNKVYGLDYTILRYGSLYGPRADEKNGLYRIVKSAIATGIMKYEGDSDAMREYIHVCDAASASVEAIDEKFRNESIVLTGQEPMLVADMLKMLAEIIGIQNENIKFVDNAYSGHYVRTPYSYQPKLGRKYIPPMHVDLGQGLIELIDDLSSEDVNK